MGSIIAKRINGQTYYYLREMARVGGKPKAVSQRYLGKAADIEAAMGGASVMPERTRHLGFGDVAGVFGVLDRLGVAEIVDEVVGSRRADAGASVGTYIALACVNRVVAPCSKLAFSDWWCTTAGDRMFGLPLAALDHRRFWDAMDALSTDQLAEIERRIDTAMIDHYDLDVSGLVLDMTNFATYIDSANEKAPIAQRGHAKQKRNDLRLVGLGLVVTSDGGVPLLSHAYPGNRHDSSQFATMIDELATRYRDLVSSGAELTVVYDAGQGSEVNQRAIEAAPLHFVSSVRPSDHPDLLSVDRRRYRKVTGFEGVTAFESYAEILGAPRRVVVTHSRNLHAKQSAGFDQTLAKASARLDEIRARLARGGGRKDRAVVEAEVAEVLRPRWLHRVVSVRLRGETPGMLRLTWRVDADARAALERELFGKRILFTDHEDWLTEQVVAAYRSQFEVEADFRQMKDPAVVSFSPMFHWTDQKIRVHVFCCVLALRVAKLMRRQAQRSGLEMSVREVLETLGGIEETVLLFPSTGGRPKARRMLTEMDPMQQRLYDLFDLGAYAPKTES